MHPLRKALINDRQLNPFSDDFNKDRLYEVITNFLKNNINLSEVDSKLLDSLKVLILFNSLFVETFQFLKKSIIDSNLSINEIFEISLSIVNREFIIIQRDTKNKIRQQGGLNFEDAFKLKINSLDESIGKIGMSSALETNIDALNVFLTYANYFRQTITPKPNPIDEKQLINGFRNIYYASSFFYVVKSEYEDRIWNNGDIESIKSENKITFRRFSIEDSILQKIGFYRLQSDSFATYCHYQEKLSKKSDFSESYKSLYRIKKKPKRIKQVFIDNGTVNYRLADGIDKNEFDNELVNSSSLITYYSFIDEINFPKQSELSLFDIIILFDVTQHLFDKTLELIYVDNGLSKLSDLNKFPCRIKKIDLRRYLTQRTYYTSKQISGFLDFICNGDKARINLWHYPLIKSGEYLLFSLLSLTQPIIVFLLDVWLEIGGFDLKKRGKLLEAYIKTEVTNSLKSRNFSFEISQNSKFKLENNSKEEEIDLIINLKSILIVAEIKCIKFHLESRDEHNALKRLRQGAIQVKRKTEFIERNKKHFYPQIGDITNKRIMRLVITNFPSFTGISLENVQIVDFLLFNSYIKTGKVSRFSTIPKNGQVVGNELIKRTLLYEDEDEFCDKFDFYMKHHPLIEMQKDNIEIKMNKLSTRGMNYDIYSEIATYKE